MSYTMFLLSAFLGLFLYLTTFCNGHSINLGKTDTVCSAEDFRCECSAKNIPILVPVPQCSYTRFWISSCKPCNDLKPEDVCPKYRLCEQCQLGGGDSCVTCPKGKFGKWCENTCSCQNGATCERNGMCICPPSYEGRNCEEKKGCGPLPIVTPPLEAILQPPDNPQTVVYTCPPDFVLSGQAVSTCISGKWSSAAPTCRPKCPILSVPANGQLVFSGSDLVEGVLAEVNCLQGYRLVGQKSLTCLSGGKWNHELPLCACTCQNGGACEHSGKCVCPPSYEGRNCEKKKGCGPLPEAPPPLEVILQPIDHPLTAIYTCPIDYVLSGQAVSTCVSGKWSSAAPTCRPKCSLLSAPANGRLVFSGSDLVEGVSAEINCSRGYRLVGPKTLTCLAGGKWNHDLPLCEELALCPDPGIVNHAQRIVMSGSIQIGDHFSQDSKIQYKCKAGFQRMGMSKILCTVDGSWSNRLPTCIRVATIVPNCLTSGSDIVAEEGISVRIMCPPECAEAEFKVWGTSIYRARSSVCQAAIHSGKITNSGGSVAVISNGNYSHFTGSASNQVESKSYPDVDKSFRFEKLKSQPLTNNSEECERGLTKLVNVCVYISNLRHAYNVANAICTNLGMHLKIPEDSHERRRLNAMIRKKNKGVQSIWADDNFQRLSENGKNGTNTSLSRKLSCPVAALEDLDFRLENKRCKDVLNYACIKKKDDASKLVLCRDPGLLDNGKAQAVGQINSVFYVGSSIEYSCDTQHYLKGEKSISCTANGIWSNAKPVCVKGPKCLLLSAPANGRLVFSSSDLVEGVMAEVTCSQSYRLVGQKTLTCLAGGKWNYELPSCEELASCPDPGIVNYAVRTVLSDFLKIGGHFLQDSTIQYKCKAGFQQMGGSKLICKFDGSWSNRLPTCTKVATIIPDCLTSGSDIIADEGVPVRIICPPECAGVEFKVWGTSIYRTRSSVCQAAIHSSKITNSGGSVAVINNGNYSHFTGSDSNYIESKSYPDIDGSFRFDKLKPQPLTSKSNECERGLAKLKNVCAYASNLHHTYEEAKAVCTNLGMHLKIPEDSSERRRLNAMIRKKKKGIQPLWAGDKLQRLSKNGKNSTHTSMYNESSCPAIVLEDTDFKLENRPCNENLSYICITKEGDASKLAVCRDPGLLDNGKVEPIGQINGIFYVGSSIEYSCDAQYYLKGEETTSCTGNGTWSGPKPVCIKEVLVTCPDPGIVNNAERTVLSGSVKIGKHFLQNSKIQYKCNVGFQQMGMSKISCTFDGSWSNRLPACIKVATVILDCFTSGSDIIAEEGIPIRIMCPPQCAGQEFKVWGTSIYRARSSVCQAAIHSAKITNSGGSVAVINNGNYSHFTGSTSNHVESKSYPDIDESFRFDKLKPQPLTSNSDECERGLTERENVCVYISNVYRSYEKAKAVCTNLGLHLEIPQDPNQRRRLAAILRKRSRNTDIPSIWADYNFQGLSENGENNTNTSIYKKTSCPSAVIEDFDFKLENRECKNDLKYVCIKKTDEASKLAVCQDPGLLHNGKVHLIGQINGIFYVGSSIEYFCDAGQYLLGEKSISCTANGTWSDPKPVCMKVDACTDPPIPIGGFVTYLPPTKTVSAQRSAFYTSRTSLRAALLPARLAAPILANLHMTSTAAPVTMSLPPGLHQLGTRAVYDCESRYYKLIGSKTRRCQEMDEWSGRPPTCMPVCGQSDLPRSPFILNGNASDIGQWPWQAGIARYAPDNNRWYLVCGASLINELWVITAAHCLTRPGTTIPREPDQFLVYLGKYHRLDSKDDEYVQVRKVLEMHIHPDFEPILFDADIALIQLDSPVQLNTRVQPICLPTEQTTRENIVEGKMGFVTGWGMIDNATYSETLLQAALPVVSKQNCVKGYEESGAPVTVTDNMFCAGYKDGRFGTCSGDSGGPMVFIDESSKERKWVLEGVVSWGTPDLCGNPNQYGGFTTISRFLNWIHLYF